MASSNAKKIDFPPSTELIPDEYEVFLDGRECVHIFAHGSMVEECRLFLSTINVRLEEKCIHKLDSYEEIIHTLDNVARTPQKDKSLLLLIFWGKCAVNGQFVLEDDEKPLPFCTIWSKFCNGHWRNTPKLFLLNAVKYKPKIQKDSFLYWPTQFETPNEGDVLIVFKKNIDMEESQQFINQLGRKIVEYREREDFATIVAAVEITQQVKSRPVLISTMLKRLFLKPSGHHLTLYESNEYIILKEMCKITNLLEKVQSVRIHDPLCAENLGAINYGSKETVDAEGRRRSSRAHSVTDSNPRKSKDGEFNRSNSSNPRRKSSASKKEPWHH